MIRVAYNTSNDIRKPGSIKNHRTFWAFRGRYCAIYVFFFMVFGQFFGVVKLKAQAVEDILLMKKLMPVHTNKSANLTRPQNKNVIHAVSTALFVFYQKYVSSQDGSHCTFYPSCSAYALESIKKKGLFIGILADIRQIIQVQRP